MQISITASLRRIIRHKNEKKEFAPERIPFIFLYKKVEAKRTLLRTVCSVIRSYKTNHKKLVATESRLRGRLQPNRRTERDFL